MAPRLDMERLEPNERWTDEKRSHLHASKLRASSA